MYVSKKMFRFYRTVIATLAMVLVFGTVGAQNIKVTGKVTDKNGEPVIGASVLLKGTKTGAATNIDGSYDISVPGNGVLVFSALSYKTLEIPVNNRSNVSVVLEDDAVLLEELVVVGFGTQKKENLTGAVSTVDVSKSLQGKPIVDVAKGLQGVVPGLTVTFANGGINSSPVINIRGMGTVNATNGGSPLIIVDNVVVSDLSVVNPEDIESISVLKDAASTSIYGARAAFGVMLVKTKSGKKSDKFQVNYSNNFAFSTPTLLPEFAKDPVAEIRATDAALSRFGGTGMEVFGMTAATLIPGIEKWLSTYKNNRDGDKMVKGEDWDIVNGRVNFFRIWNPVDVMFQKWIPQQNHNIQISGGTDKLNFYVSGAYNYQEGVLKINTDKINKYNLTLGVNANVNKWMDLEAKILTRQYSYDYPFTDYMDPYYTMWRWGSYMPYGSYTDENGTFGYFRAAQGHLAMANMNNYKETFTTTGINAIFKIAKNFNIRSEFSYTTNNGLRNINGGLINLWDFWGATPPLRMNQIGAGANDRVEYNSSRSTQITSNTYGTFEQAFGDHKFKVIAGLSFENGDYIYQSSQRRTLMDPSNPQLPLATGDQYVGGDRSDWAVGGLFGRINYDYLGKYLLELNGRFDSSSSFPADSRWAFFPSASIGYRITEEPWMKNIKKVLTDAKIRASYGSIGNQDVGQDRFIATMTTSANLNWLIPAGTRPIFTGNPANVSRDLKWETINTINIGLDLKFLKNNLVVSADWFQRQNNNMIAPGATLPSAFGAAAAAINAGSMRTRGWEITASYTHNFGKDAYGYVNASLSDYESVITEWTGNDNKMLYTNYAGKVVGEIWGFKNAGFFKDANDVATSPSQTTLQNGSFVYGPGDVKYADLDNNQIINGGNQTLSNPGDLTVIGNTTPRYQYSFRLGGGWKGFDIDMYFQGVGKRDMWGTGSMVIPLYNSANNTMYEHQMDFWSANNPDAFYPLPSVGSEGASTIANMAGISNSQNGTGRNFYPQDKYLINLAYLRMKNLTIGYTIPARLTKKISIDKVRVYFSGQNLFEFKATHLPIDPEVTSGSPSFGAYYGRTMPFTRTLSFGVQISL